MKRLLISLLMLLVLMASCKEEPKKFDYTWTGQEEKGIRYFVPVCIVWYKQLLRVDPVWKPYKCFSQTDANDMRNIILRLTSPEKKEPNPNIKSKDKLSLIFYNGFPEELTVREVYFEIQDKTFIGPTGKSGKLAKILLEKEKVRSRFYYPYKNLGPTHYLDRWERILESLRKQAERLKAEKDAEAQKRIEEPNQPE